MLTQLLGRDRFLRPISRRLLAPPRFDFGALGRVRERRPSQADELRSRLFRGTPCEKRRRTRSGRTRRAARHGRGRRRSLVLRDAFVFGVLEKRHVVCVRSLRHLSSEEVKRSKVGDARALGFAAANRRELIDPITKATGGVPLAPNKEAKVPVTRWFSRTGLRVPARDSVAAGFSIGAGPPSESARRQVDKQGTVAMRPGRQTDRQESQADKEDLALLGGPWTSATTRSAGSSEPVLRAGGEQSESRRV